MRCGARKILALLSRHSAVLELRHSKWRARPACEAERPSRGVGEKNDGWFPDVVRMNYGDKAVRFPLPSSPPLTHLINSTVRSLHVARPP